MTDTELLDALQERILAGAVCVRTCRSGIKIEDTVGSVTYSYFPDGFSGSLRQLIEKFLEGRWDTH